MRAEAGKGCKPRPSDISGDEYLKRWEDTFGKKDSQETQKDSSPDFSTNVGDHKLQ
jgi:hypothetical protein